RKLQVCRRDNTNNVPETFVLGIERPSCVSGRHTGNKHSISDHRSTKRAATQRHISHLISTDSKRNDLATESQRSIGPQRRIRTTGPRESISRAGADGRQSNREGGRVV